MIVKHPKVTVALKGATNPFHIVSAGVNALRDAKVREDDIETFRLDVMMAAPSRMLTVVGQWMVMQ